MQKDEIKEIIERLKRIDHKEYIAFEFADSATFDEMARCFEERKKMADYITNLQNENMKYDQCLTELTDNYKDLQKELTNLQEDYNNEAEENSKLSEWLVEKQQRIEGLEAENERLNNIINELEKYILNHYIVGHTIQNTSLDDILDKLKELKENK